MPSREDILEIAKTLRYDLTAAQAKLTELATLAAQLPDDEHERPRCPDCELPFRGPRTLAEHRYHQHDGPTPEHWLEAEQRTDDGESAPVVAVVAGDVQARTEGDD